MRVIELTMTGSPVQVAPNNPQAPAQTPYASMMIVQPVTASATLGDNTVTATKGIVIPAANLTPMFFANPRGSALSQYWLVGTNGDKVEVLYETAG